MERPEGNKKNNETERNVCRFVVSADQAERRLDRVLRGLFDDVPLGAIMRGIRKGQVRLNGEKTTGSERLAEGDTVEVPWSERATGDVFPKENPREYSPLATLYRDGDIWCVEKEAGLLSQPDKSGGDSLITRAWGELSWIRRDFRPALIHRLDRNVSGVVAIALNAPVLRTLARLMREGHIKKIYRALVWGSPPAFGEIVNSLYKNERENKVYVDERGREALTRYRKINGAGPVSLVELELVTGRPHQARAHLASIGHPIVGDTKYGRRNAGDDANRLMLHAYSLSFPEDPDLPERVRGLIVESPLPRAFSHFG